MSQKKWIIRELLAVTSDYLENKDIDSPRLCAEILLAYQLKTTRIRLYLDFDQPVSERDLNEYRTLIQRRLKREPVQYITGVQEFWSMEFKVGPQVLIPRPETEVLVEQAISVLRESAGASGTERPSVLDIGTGSGAIALSIARELPEADVWACDISADALSVAQTNAVRHGLETRVRFLESDLLSVFHDTPQLFDVIVSNPPYIPREDYDALPPEVGRYEPRSALDGGEGGLLFIKRLILDARECLRPGGWLMMEMAPFQTAGAMELGVQAGFYGEQKIIRDYSHKERVVMARRS